MKKRVLAILMAAAMSMSLIACGGGEEEAATKEVAVEEETVEEDAVEEDAVVEEEVVEEATGDYTEEQMAYIEAYNQMLDDYNTVIDMANEVPQLLEKQELVDVMNELAAGIEDMTELMSDPANLTDEFLAGVDVAMDQTYATLNRLQTLAELLPILTIAGVGADEEENTYYFAFNEEETVGVMVILSADQTQNVYCAGDMVVSEDGTYTISDGEYEMSMLVEVVEDGLAITMQDGTVVGMVGAEPMAVVDAMLSIQEATENVNE